MGIYSIKPKFQRVLEPIESWCVAHHVSPTAINMAGLVFAVLLGLALYFSSMQHLLLFLVPVFAFVRTALNALDGLVSRKMGVASGYGEVLNEFSDRISDAVIFMGLAFSEVADTVLGLILVIVILLNSYLSIASKAAGGSRQYGGIMGKADRMFYLSVAAVAIGLTGRVELWDVFLLLSIAGVLITLVQRFVSIREELTRHA